MIKLTTEENGFIFQWFSNVLGHELSESQFKQFQDGVFSPLFDLLAEQGFQTQVEKIQQEIQSLGQDKFAYLELAADFTELFLLDGQSSALPYASVYLKEDDVLTHLHKMDALLEKFQLQVNKESKEPSDHLGVYLEIARQFALADELATQEVFIQEDFLPWLEKMHEKALKVPSKTKFYQTVITLLVDVLKAK